MLITINLCVRRFQLLIIVYNDPFYPAPINELKLLFGNIVATLKIQNDDKTFESQHLVTTEEQYFYMVKPRVS